MKTSFLVLLLFQFWTLLSFGQTNEAYIRENAIPLQEPLTKSDALYETLKPWPLIMVAEMHGTEEPAALLASLAILFDSRGDSVQVGFEIPPEWMQAFFQSKADSAIYQSVFFGNPSWLDGRQSFAWAGAIARIRKHPHISVFFFDVNEEEKRFDRDSMMYRKIRKEILEHPEWRTLTISGNAHTLLAPEERKMAGFLHEDRELKLEGKIASLYHYYQSGSCFADFGKGLEEKHFQRSPNNLDTLVPYSRYLLKTSARSTFPYTYIYYTNKVHPSPMVKGNFEPNRLREEMHAIFERDQKTRKKSDSLQFIAYIDSTNMEAVEAYIRRFGWVSLSLAGPMPNYTQWLVLQHAPLAKQLQYLPLLEESVAAGESQPIDLAFLEDRIAMYQNREQRYGTQVVQAGDGKYRFHPIEKEAQVNERRASLGLEPIEEYAKKFGIEYHPGQ